MSTNQTARILKLERRLPRRSSPTPSGFDSYRLTPREMAELDDLLRPLAPLPGETMCLDDLTDEQLDRTMELVRKAEGLEPNPAYLGLRRRAVALGPCRCPACARREGSR